MLCQILENASYPTQFTNEVRFQVLSLIQKSNHQGRLRVGCKVDQVKDGRGNDVKGERDMKIKVHSDTYIYVYITSHVKRPLSN